MFYAEFVKQATDLADVTDKESPAIDATAAAKAFGLLQTSLLALNTDDRLTFAVDDISLELSKPKLVFLQRENPAEPAEPLAADEQAFHPGYPVELPPAYVISGGCRKMRMVSFESFVCDYICDASAYAFRLEYGRAALHLRVFGNLKIGLKRPLDIPASINDEVKLTGSALNLLKYKLATELMALYKMPQFPLVEQKYNEYMQRHMKIKTEILPPPVLDAGTRPRRL
jgi:hypothetical protein